MPAERLLGWVEGWALRRPARIGGVNPWLVVVRTVTAAQRDRITGLAAEMAFFALLSLIPAVVAVGAGLSLLERWIDPASVAQARVAAVDALGAIFTGEVRQNVIEPLVEGLFAGQRGGLALSGVLAAVYLASRVFTATIRALDAAYNVEEQRGVIVQRLLAVLFAFGAVIVAVLTLLLAVVGPLFGTGDEIAARLGLSEAFAASWAIARWPTLLLIAVGFFAAVYRLGPNVANRWRDSLPGAVLGVLLWLAVSGAFHVYLSTVGTPGQQFTQIDEAVAILGQVVGAVVAAVLWTFLSGLTLLIGGELNSEIAAERGRVEASPTRGGARP